MEGRTRTDLGGELGALRLEELREAQTLVDRRLLQLRPQRVDLRAQRVGLRSVAARLQLRRQRLEAALHRLLDQLDHRCVHRRRGVDRGRRRFCRGGRRGLSRLS